MCAIFACDSSTDSSIYFAVCCFYTICVTVGFKTDEKSYLCAPVPCLLQVWLMYSLRGLAEILCRIFIPPDLPSSLSLFFFFFPRRLYSPLVSPSLKFVHSSSNHQHCRFKARGTESQESNNLLTVIECSSWELVWALFDSYSFAHSSSTKCSLLRNLHPPLRATRTQMNGNEHCSCIRRRIECKKSHFSPEAACLLDCQEKEHIP